MKGFGWAADFPLQIKALLSITLALDYPPPPSPSSLLNLFPFSPLISIHTCHLILCIKPRPGLTEVCVFLDPLDRPSRSQSPIAGSQLRIPAHSAQIPIGLLSPDYQPAGEQTRPLCISLGKLHVEEGVAEFLPAVCPTSSSSP